MAVKTRPLSPHVASEIGQGALFEQSPFSAQTEIPLDRTTQTPNPFVDLSHPAPVAEQPTVNLIDRAEQLQIVTDKLAKINRTRGLAEVLETAKGKQVQERYRGDAEYILYKAEAIHSSRMRDAKHAFARASGMWAMIESGAVTEDDAKEMTQEMWKDFLKQYADDNQASRVKLRRQQARVVRALTKTRRK
jgi:hypothetical protein